MKKRVWKVRLVVSHHFRHIISWGKCRYLHYIDIHSTKDVFPHGTCKLTHKGFVMMSNWFYHVSLSWPEIRSWCVHKKWFHFLVGVVKDQWFWTIDLQKIWKDKRFWSFCCRVFQTFMFGNECKNIFFLLASSIVEDWKCTVVALLFE